MTSIFVCKGKKMMTREELFISVFPRASGCEKAFNPRHHRSCSSLILKIGILLPPKTAKIHGMPKKPRRFMATDWLAYGCHSSIQSNPGHRACSSECITLSLPSCGRNELKFHFWSSPDFPKSTTGLNKCTRSRVSLCSQSNSFLIL